MNDQDSQRRVVIIGGGFAGLFAARMLRRAPVRVTLIDRRPHHLFQPLLYQCSTGILSEGKIAVPLRDLLRKHKNADFVLAEVTGIDTDGRRVLATRPLGDQLEFGYDYLIVAAGVQQSYFGHDEFAQWAPGMKTIEHALVIRRRVFGAFELADTAVDPAERSRWLTFALVGAGPTGVELAGQIREVATKTLRAEYRHIKPEDARVLLFDGGDAPLAPFGPELSAKAARTLDKLGVEQHMHSIVTDIDATGLSVRAQDGTVTRHGYRREARPGRPHHGRRRLHHSRPPRDLRDRGRHEPEQAPWCVRGSHAGRHIRRGTHQTRGRREDAH
jgi:NADH dehydrogenase